MSDFLFSVLLTVLDKQSFVESAEGTGATQAKRQGL